MSEAYPNGDARDWVTATRSNFKFMSLLGKIAASDRSLGAPSVPVPVPVPLFVVGSEDCVYIKYINPVMDAKRDWTVLRTSGDLKMSLSGP